MKGLNGPMDRARREGGRVSERARRGRFAEMEGPAAGLGHGRCRRALMWGVKGGDRSRSMVERTFCSDLDHSSRRGWIGR